MIVSASRRTDIPALYPGWLLHRLAEGFAEVPHPYRPSAIRRVDLRPPPVGDLEALVLWTRNPGPLLHAVPGWEDQGLPTLWLVTVTGYPTVLEPQAPKLEAVLNTVAALSGMVGPDRIGWRYDPIFLAPQSGLDTSFHRQNFRALARDLAPHVGRCILSTFDDYAKTRKRLKAAGAESAPPGAYGPVLKMLANEARQLGISVQSCAEDSQVDVLPAGPCIDPDLLNRLWGLDLLSRKDPGQRRRCRCARSIDIGVYDTCRHGCRYCYANGDPARVAARAGRHAVSDSRLA